MTNQRAMELLMIERACVRRASGMEYIQVNLGNDQWYEGYARIMNECDRKCESCVLVQDSKELLEMYDYVIKMMTEEICEEEAKPTELRDWQRNCDPRQPLAI